MPNQDPITLSAFNERNMSIKQKKISLKNVLFKMSPNVITHTLQNTPMEFKKSVKTFIGKRAKLFSKKKCLMQPPDSASVLLSRNATKNYLVMQNLPAQVLIQK